MEFNNGKGGGGGRGGKKLSLGQIFMRGMPRHAEPKTNN